MENEGGSRKLSPVLEESNDILQGSGDEEKLLNGHAGTTDQFVNTRCRFYIEPMLFLFALSQFPLMQISSQYIYKREWERIDVNGTFNYSFDAPTNHCIADPDDQLSQLRSKVQSAASYFSLQTALCSTIPAIFTSLFLGAYSDRVGRKYAIIPPILGQMVSSFLYAIVIHFNLPIQVLFVGAFLYGCCGYYVAFLLGCLAYVADTTTKERRSFRILLVELIMFGPTILSSAGTGFWLKAMGFIWLFVIAFICNVIIGIYAIFVIPETIRRDPSAKFFSSKHLKKAIIVFTVDDETKRRWKILLLLSALFMSLLAGFAFGIDTLYEMNAPLCWGPVLIGIQSALSVAVAVVGSAVCGKLFGYCLRDAWVTVVSGTVSIAMNVYKSFVWNTLTMLTTSVFSVCSVLFTPTIRSMLSKVVKKEEYGAVFGAVAVVELLCALMGSAILNPIYAATNESYRGAVYLVMAAMLFTSVCLMLIYALKTRKDKYESVLDVPGVDP